MRTALALLLPVVLAASSAAAQAAPREWRIRVPLDSGHVLVAVTRTAASITVVSPEGTFVEVLPSAARLSQWADAAEALAAPQVLRDAAAPDDSTKWKRQFATAVLHRASTGDEDNTELRLARIDAPDADYLLAGANGAWTFTLGANAAQATTLLAALRGETLGDAAPFDPPVLRGPQGDRPDAEGAWLGDQVDEQARIARDFRAPYPEAMRGSNQRPRVRLQFIIDSTGTARPSSVRLVGAAHPAFAQSARVALLNTRFHPAVKGRRTVSVLSVRDYFFAEGPEEVVR